MMKLSHIAVFSMTGMFASSMPALAQVDSIRQIMPSTAPDADSGADDAVHPASVPLPSPTPVRPATAQASLVVVSESGEEEEALQLSLEDLFNIKITVASREEESVSEAPSVVSVFTREDIRRLGVRTVQQLLNFVPGFQANPDESDHFLSIDVRGRSTSAAEAVLVMIDGQRVNDLYFGSPAFSHGLLTENIEQIEIIRGPGSALYGANAFLAVIDIKTNRSRSDVTVGAGNMNRRYGAINLAKSLGELKLASFVKLYSDEGDSYPNITDAAGKTVTMRDPAKTMDGTLRPSTEGLTCGLAFPSGNSAA